MSNAVVNVEYKKPSVEAKEELLPPPVAGYPDVPPPRPNPCGNVFAILLGIVLAAMIMADQLNQAGIWVLGMLALIIFLPILHLLDRRPTASTRDSYVTATLFLGPLAATFFNTLLLSLIFMNALWARWCLGVEFVINDIYGVNATDVKTLGDCASTGSVFDSFEARCKAPLGTFLAYPWALYWHASGAITTLVVGPFQLSIPFRLRFPIVHKRLGYLYCCGVAVGAFGSWPLIYYTSSGVVAGSGFFTLSIMWLASLTIAMRSLLVLKDRQLHRRWMSRNYYLTFAAVPFRFLPLLTDMISGFNLGPSAYGIGGWLTLLSVIVPGELYIHRFESTRRLPPAIPEVAERL